MREALRKAQREAETENREVAERLINFKARLRNEPNNVTDAEILEEIREIFFLKGDPAFDEDEDYATLISSLSFTKTSLDDNDRSALKQAWSDFLDHTFPQARIWDGHCDFGTAQWYLYKGMAPHAIAVYEHILGQIRRGELAGYEDEYEGWLLQLFKLCVEKGLIERARYVAELIGDYYDDGLITLDAYVEVLALQVALRYREFGDLLECHRDEAGGSLRSKYGPLIDSLHGSTKRLIIDAELWSDDRIRHLEPATGPRLWALAIEAEFHHKVVVPNRSILEKALLDSTGKSPLKPKNSCSVGQIARLIREARFRPFLGAVFSNLRGGRGFLKSTDFDIPEMVLSHRTKIAHFTAEGTYNLSDCNLFLRTVRGTDWVFRFMAAIQPS